MLLAPAMAHTEDDPLMVDLLAGQTWDIGQVLVWNDSDYLYVKFVSEGDCLLETHVHVASSLEDIPQKNGNPIPGKFAYADDHGCVNEYTYPIPLTWAAGTNLYIAAHASTGVSQTMLVCSDATETYTAYSGPGTGAAACVEVPSPRSGTAVPAWQHPAWISNVNPQFTCGTWVWEAEYAVNYICGDIVDFTKTFNVDGYPVGGTLKLTADNGYLAKLNDYPLGSDGLTGDWRASNLTESYVTTAMAAWSSVETYDLAGLVLEGENTLLFETANEYMYPDDGSNPVGTVTNNPGGLIYEAEVHYFADGETAWGAGSDFPGKNWAMYFGYTVQAMEVCVDFGILSPGDPVEGLGTVDPLLNIQDNNPDPPFDPQNQSQYIVVPGGALNSYNTTGGVVNGCLSEAAGFGNYVWPNASAAQHTSHDLTFTFAAGTTISGFSIKMYDYGDWFPVGTRPSMTHTVKLVAYSGAAQVAEDVLTFTSTGNSSTQRIMTTLNGVDIADIGLGTTGGDVGDSCGVLNYLAANPGTGPWPGRWQFQVQGSNIDTVQLLFVDTDPGAAYNQSLDPGVAFDTLCFTVE
jgi:hypothetical protein